MNRTLLDAQKLLKNNYRHVLEFGVCTGSTIKQLRGQFGSEYKMFGFDSFAGLPEDWVGTRSKKGSMSTGGRIPNIDNVKFYKGWFKDTIPEYLKIAEPIALLHVDCDLYSSTIDVLFGLADYICSGSILVFDEWYYNHRDIEQNRQHEQKAFYEWVKANDVEYELGPNLGGHAEGERQIVIIMD